MIIGHQKQWQFLKKSLELSRLSHAYLFFGPSRIGKKTLALEFVKFLFCQEAPHHFSSSPSDQTNFTKSGGGCQACQSLKKKIHPDFSFIDPQKKEIQISQIRDLQWKLSLRPSLAPSKVAIIDEAHCLNSEAQSCLLKTLEEPKGKAILILITEYPESLFPTILSRVQKIRFSLVSSNEIENFLKNQGLSSEKAQKITFLSFGKPGLALDFFSNPHKLDDYNLKIKELINLFQTDLSFRFQYIKNLVAKKENLKEILDIWLRYFRDLLHATINNFTHPNFEETWVGKQLAPNKFLRNYTGQAISNQKRYSFSKLKKIINLIQNTNFLISSTNVNQRLALEQLMLEL